MNKPEYFLPEEKYRKAIGSLRLQMAGIFDFLKVDDKLPARYQYGMGDYVPGAIEEAVGLAEDFGLRIRGVDKPISIENVRRKLYGKG